MTNETVLRSYTPEGRLHMEWTGRRIMHNGSRIAVHSIPGTPVRHLTKDLQYPLSHHCVGIFDAAESFNTLVDFELDGSWIRTYLNVSRSTAVSPGQVDWVDLWIDIDIRPQRTELLDRAELDAAVTAGAANEEERRTILAVAARVIASPPRESRPHSLESLLSELAAQGLEQER